MTCYPGGKPQQLELSLAQIDAIAEAVVAKLAEKRARVWFTAPLDHD